MKASDWIPTLPDGRSAASLAERERMIIAAVQSGWCVHDWHAFEIKDGPHRALVSVSRDTLRIGEPGDSVRVSLSARAQLQVAKLLGAQLLTPKLCDEIFMRATRKPTRPPTQYWWKDGTMALTNRMLEQSTYLDGMVDIEHNELVANVGKDWVELRHMPTNGHAVNYGFYVQSGGSPAVSHGLRVIQSPGSAHSADHTDYSQLPRFVSDLAVFDDQPIDFRDLLEHPIGSHLVAHDGPFNGGNERAPDTIPAPPPKRSSGNLPAVAIGDEPGVPFVQARNFTAANRSRVDLLVIHTAELDLTKLAAENLMTWCAGPNAPKASWHYAVDRDSITQSVRERDVAWHAKQANRVGIGIELCARAAWTAGRWSEPDALDMLKRAAELAARICKRWDIPIVQLTPDQVRSGVRGVCGHVDVTKAYATPGGHIDPGRSFPWLWFMSQIKNS